ncbi:T9SS type A sorting domain-containing protein [bacterium]|nr:T9SS type A sorting domain-containing protein [bacterium]
MKHLKNVALFLLFILTQCLLSVAQTNKGFQADHSLQEINHLGSIYNGGGANRGMVVYNGHAYIDFPGSGLAIFYEDGNTFIEDTSNDTLFFIPIAVQQNYMTARLPSGRLALYELDNPLAPRFRDTFQYDDDPTIPSTGLEMTFFNDFAYTDNYQDTIDIWNFSDPDSIFYSNSIDVQSNSSYLYQFTVNRGYLYIVKVDFELDEAYAYYYNVVHHPGTPEYEGILFGDGDRNIGFIGTYAMFSDDDEIMIYDNTNPNNFTPLTSFTNPFTSDYRPYLYQAAGDDFLYAQFIVGYPDWSIGIQFFSLDESNEVDLLDSLTINREIETIVSTDTRLYVKSPTVFNDTLLQVYDISDLDRIQEIYTRTVNPNISAITSIGSTAYITFLGGDSAIHIVDFSDPSQPVEVNQLEDYEERVNYIFSSDNALVTVGSDYDIRIYDCTNPIDPTLASVIPLNHPVSSLNITNTRFYLSFGQILYIYDISNLYNPVLLSETEDPSLHSYNTAVLGDSAYVAWRHDQLGGHLQFYSVEDPQNVTLIHETLYDDDDINDFIIKDDKLYLSLYLESPSIRIIDIRDIRNPVNLGYLSIDCNQIYPVDIPDTDMIVAKTDSALITLRYTPIVGLQIEDSYEFDDFEHLAGLSYDNNVILAATPSTLHFFSIDVNSVAEEPERPSTFSIQQIAPNPFNATTTVTVTLPTPTNFEYRIFNLLGQQVYTSHPTQLAAGSHHISISAESLASGVYILQASTDSGAESRKFVVLK